MKQRPSLTRSVLYGSTTALVAYWGLRWLPQPAWLPGEVVGSVAVVCGATVAGLACDRWLDRREQRLRTYFRLLLQVGDSLRRHSVIHLSLHSAITLTGAISGGLWLREGTDAFRIAATWNAAPDYRQRYYQISLSDLLPEGVPPIHTPVLLSERELPLPIRALRQDAPLGAAILSPVYCRQSLQGYFVLGFEHPPRLSPDERLALRALSDQLVNALRNAQDYEALLHEANTDPLTSVFSRRYLDSCYQQELTLAAQTSKPLSVAMIDVDGMKTINDHWGHPVGDRVLRTVATLLKKVVRENDVVARYGGDEFVILMPDTTGEQAGSILRRVQEQLAALNVSEELPVLVSLSLGWEQLGKNTPDPLVGADAAMYRNKQRNASKASSPEQSHPISHE